MQSNTGSNVGNQPFVKLFEHALTEFVILEKAKQGDVTKENLRTAFKGTLQIEQQNIESCLRELVSNGHLKEQNNKYTITDDGREDVQKVEAWIPEVQQYVQTKGQGQGQGQRQGTMNQAPTQGGSNVGGGQSGTTRGNNPTTGGGGMNRNENL